GQRGPVVEGQRIVERQRVPRRRLRLPHRAPDLSGLGRGGVIGGRPAEGLLDRRRIRRHDPIVLPLPPRIAGEILMYLNKISLSKRAHRRQQHHRPKKCSSGHLPSHSPITAGMPFLFTVTSWSGLMLWES